MTDPREDAAREWLGDGHREDYDENDECVFCVFPWSEHPKMLLAALDAADHAAGIYRVDQPPGVSMTLRPDSTHWTPS